MSYRGTAKIEESVKAFDPMSPSYELGVAYENTVRAVSDGVA
jgi:hypothetical protein